MEASKQAKHIISISLGSSKRDASAILDFAGQRVSIERRGTDGDLVKARKLMEQWDG